MSAGQLRTLKGRIKSVENTKKITRAMEMVSAAKLRRFQDTMVKALPYMEDLQAMLGRIIRDQKNSDQGGKYSHPYFEDREEKKIGVVVMTSDSGLCGSFNMELIDEALDFLGDKRDRVKLIGVGKMGIRALQRNKYSFLHTHQDIKQDQVESTIQALQQEISNLFLSGEVDSFYVVYSHFVTVSSYKCTVEKLLPLKEPEGKNLEEERVPYIYEPSPKELFEKLIPVFFECKVRMFLLESFVSEHTARMNAMHQATKNAKEMIDSLVLVRNKIRQAIITKEIIEIVSGSQALKK